VFYTAPNASENLGVCYSQKVGRRYRQTILCSEFDTDWIHPWPGLGGVTVTPFFN